MAFNLKKILRALMFSTSEPLSIKDVQAVITRYHAEMEARKNRRGEEDFDGDTPENVEGEQAEIEDIVSQVPTLLTATQIREAMEEISGELEENDEVYRLLQSSSGFKFAISKDYAEWVRLLRNDPRPQKLTRAALETLAIIAYRQPVTRAEIEAIRGVNADSAITRLSEKELIYISGRADLPGRPIQYATTQNFLDFIGINSLEELPSSDVLSPGQISEWIKRASTPSGLNDREMGLPEEDEADKQEKTEAPEEGETSPELQDPEVAARMQENFDKKVVETFEAQTPEDIKINEEFGVVPREPVMEVGDEHFPRGGGESAGSIEMFEPVDDKQPDTEDE